eukprot:gnl/MRDRNA2_/MRDRNA2_96225_c0_seq1.p1 gnl/MRDRNA2_/MRDRNA2_96225_c0~~gnl/MRDRNA2_/MRDRNA2_96225_c0_seq1.p1  ORF type:complete len:374 (+),score=63.88 gnl/MRDRNA2_/MRDRNA2_96225_c0_seq1:65-1186(+)
MTATSDVNEEEANDPAYTGFVSQIGTLNSDPHNMRAEALAMEICMRDAGACKTWSEQEMVFSFGGGEVPGTPDFMYEDENGVLICGQVVRVPLVHGMSRTVISETIYCTVLTKLVKSQTWMKSCYIIPEEFIIFLWLPFFVHRKRKRLAEDLAIQVQSDGWPFRLRFEVPDRPEALFPPLFAASLNPRRKQLSKTDLSNFDPRDFQEEEDSMEWDIFAFEEDADVFAFEDDADETENIMYEYESSESDEEEQDVEDNFFDEQGRAAGEYVPGQDFVKIILLGSSLSQERSWRPTRYMPSLGRLHPLETRDAKPGPQELWQRPCQPGFPCLANRIQTWDAKPCITNQFSLLRDLGDGFLIASFSHSAIRASNQR